MDIRSPFVPSEVEGREANAILQGRASISILRIEVYPERLPRQAVEGLGTNGAGQASKHIC
jgi:hypothetical protein